MSLWSCTTCSKSFKRKGDLTRHKAIHTGIKPYICETCGKGFVQFSGLKTHRNVQFKPFTCGIGTCTKAFGDPSSRTRHRREIHRHEGAYQCGVTSCGTRIKRRSAFMAHLRKHGLDPGSLDVDAMIVQCDTRGASVPGRSAPPDVENTTHDETESCNVSSFLDDASGYYTMGDRGGDTAHLGWFNNGPSDCQQANWLPENNTSFPGPMLDQAVNFGPLDFPHDIYTYMPSNLEIPLYLDGMSHTSIDYPLLVASPPNLEPFLEAGSDSGSQSIWPSPSSTYSVSYTANLNDDVASLSLANDVSQEPLLHNLII